MRWREVSMALKECRKVLKSLVDVLAIEEVLKILGLFLVG